MEARAPLGPAFRRLWTGAAVSYVGDGLVLAAMPLLAEKLTRHHGSADASALLVTGIVMMRYAAWFLLGLIGGVVADRTDRQRVMVYVDLARTVAIAMLGITIVEGRPPIALLWITAFLLGCGEVFFDTASEAMLPSVIEDDSLLERANSRLFVTQSLSSELIGPPIGAFLFAFAMALPFLLDAWSFLAAAMIVLTLRGSYRPRPRGAAPPAGAPAPDDTPDATPDETGHDAAPAFSPLPLSPLGPDAHVAEPASSRAASVRADIAAGWHYTRNHRLLRSIILLGCAWNFFAVGSEATTVLFAKRELHMSDTAYGFAVTGFAVGGVLAAWLTERIVERIGPGTTILATFLLGGVAGMTAALSHNAIVFVVGFSCSYAAGTAASIVVVTLRQQLAPDDLRGRVSAMFRVGIFAAAALGALVMGLLAQSVGLRAPLWALGAAGFALFVGALPEVNNTTIAAAKAASPAQVTEEYP